MTDDPFSTFFKHTASKTVSVWRWKVSDPPTRWMRWGYSFNTHRKDLCSLAINAFKTALNHCKKVLDNAKCSYGQEVQSKVKKILKNWTSQILKDQHQIHEQRKSGWFNYYKWSRGHIVVDKLNHFASVFVSNSTLYDKGHSLLHLNTSHWALSEKYLHFSI